MCLFNLPTTKYHDSVCVIGEGSKKEGGYISGRVGERKREGERRREGRKERGDKRRMNKEDGREKETKNVRQLGENQVQTILTTPLCLIAH